MDPTHDTIFASATIPLFLLTIAVCTGQAMNNNDEPTGLTANCHDEPTKLTANYNHEPTRFAATVCAEQTTNHNDEIRERDG